jgi:thioredoxin reductase (NADPH)
MATSTNPGALYDSLVIGGGPAGLSAALQLARFNRRVLLFDAGGGRARFHQVNHNYLGFPGGIPARDLVDLGRRQVREYPVAVIDEPVLRADRDEEAFLATAANGCTYRGRTVILATGVRDHFPLFPAWQDYVGRSLFWCIVCDGYSTRGKRIVVVGNDGAAGVTALQFLEFTAHVTLLTNAPEERLGPAVCQALERRGVPLVIGEIAGVDGQDGILASLTLQDGRSLELDFLFSLQGQTPNSELAATLGVGLSPGGFILANANQETAVPGVFAAGDVTRDLAHQVCTAVHEGNTAATAANYYLYAPDLKHETYRER